MTNITPWAKTMNRITAPRGTPAAMASMGITSTQNHQYNQPMVKTAQRPMACSA